MTQKQVVTTSVEMGLRGYMWKGQTLHFPGRKGVIDIPGEAELISNTPDECLTAPQQRSFLPLLTSLGGCAGTAGCGPLALSIPPRHRGQAVWHRGQPGTVLPPRFNVEIAVPTRIHLIIGGKGSSGSAFFFKCKWNVARRLLCELRACSPLRLAEFKELLGCVTWVRGTTKHSTFSQASGAQDFPARQENDNLHFSLQKVPIAVSPPPRPHRFSLKSAWRC